MREMKYKKFINNGNGDCVYCHERRHDCRCDEETAKSVTKPKEIPPMPEGLTDIERLTFFVNHPTTERIIVCGWRKDNKWFKSGYDLVDYHNKLGT